FGDATRRPRYRAGERTKTLAQAAPVDRQAAVDVHQVPCASDAAAETDRTQAPAPAEPEPGFVDMCLERPFPKQGLRGVDRQQPLEDICSGLFPLRAVDTAILDGFAQAGREAYGCELVGQERPVRLRERRDEPVEVAALDIAQLSGRDRRADRLPHADPIAIQVVRKEAERSRTPANQPPEDRAATNVQQTPTPA